MPYNSRVVVSCLMYYYPFLRTAAKYSNSSCIMKEYLDTEVVFTVSLQHAAASGDS